jgi:Tfp pilus assembly protein PilO
MITFFFCIMFVTSIAGAAYFFKLSAEQKKPTKRKPKSKGD